MDEPSAARHPSSPALRLISHEALQGSSLHPHLVWAQHLPFHLTLTLPTTCLWPASSLTPVCFLSRPHPQAQVMRAPWASVCQAQFPMGQDPSLPCLCLQLSMGGGLAVREPPPPPLHSRPLWKGSGAGPGLQEQHHPLTPSAGWWVCCWREGGLVGPALSFRACFPLLAARGRHQHADQAGLGGRGPG